MDKKKRRARIFPIWVRISFIVTALFVILALIAPRSRALADFVNSYISTPIRVSMSFLSGFIPFSLFEIFFILLLPALLLLIVLLVRSTKTLASALRRILSILGVVSILFSGYLAVMTIPYNTTPISVHLSIKDGDVDADEIYRATVIARDEVNRLAEELTGEGVTEFPYSREELSKMISDAYARVSEEVPFFYAFDSTYKEIINAGIMSDMGIAGIYMYITGEANVNTLYPDYDTTFSAAHELAHQRGINRENEANFMAFYVLSESEDVYLRYSAYLNIYEYLASALYRSDKALYAKVRDGLNPRAVKDIAASQAITREHQQSPLFELMNKVNDAYLKSNGTEGVVTYGYVARLAAQYLLYGRG